jgi:hypothetical protein
MSGLSYYESRIGALSCTPEECFKFVTDLRNLGQFAPGTTIRNWQADEGSCSFNVAYAGDINIDLDEKVPFSEAVFRGSALKENDFRLKLNISGTDRAEVKVSLEADLNPMLKMVAGSAIEQFLAVLITEMEKFRGWTAGQA